MCSLRHGEAGRGEALLSRGGGGLTCSVQVDHQAVPHVLLNQLQGPLEYLSGARLPHGVGVPRVPEQGQQVVGRAGPAGRGAGADRKNRTNFEEKLLTSKNVIIATKYVCSYFCRDVMSRT